MVDWWYQGGRFGEWSPGRLKVLKTLTEDIDTPDAVRKDAAKGDAGCISRSSQDLCKGQVIE